MAETDIQEKYEKLVELLKEEQALSKKLITINKKISTQNIEMANNFIKSELENDRMKGVLKKGIFFEYNNDPATITFVPALGDLTYFQNKTEKPTRLMYSFKFADIGIWIEDVHSLMGKDDSKIHRIEEEDLA